MRVTSPRLVKVRFVQKPKEIAGATHWAGKMMVNLVVTGCG